MLLASSTAGCDAPDDLGAEAELETRSASPRDERELENAAHDEAGCNVVVEEAAEVHIQLPSSGHARGRSNVRLPVQIANMSEHDGTFSIEALIAADERPLELDLKRTEIAAGDEITLVLASRELPIELSRLEYSGQLRIRVSRVDRTGTTVLAISEPVYLHADDSDTVHVYDSEVRDREFGFGDFRHARARAHSRRPLGAVVKGTAVVRMHAQEDGDV